MERVPDWLIKTRLTFREFAFERDKLIPSVYESWKKTELFLRPLIRKKKKKISHVEDFESRYVFLGPIKLAKNNKKKEKVRDGKSRAIDNLESHIWEKDAPPSVAGKNWKME